MDGGLDTGTRSWARVSWTIAAFLGVTFGGVWARARYLERRAPILPVVTDSGTGIGTVASEPGIDAGEAGIEGRVATETLATQAEPNDTTIASAPFVPLTSESVAPIAAPVACDLPEANAATNSDGTREEAGAVSFLSHVLPEGVETSSIPVGERHAIQMLERMAMPSIWPSDDGLSRASEGVQIGSDDFFLGHGESYSRAARGAPSTPGPAGPSAGAPAGSPAAAPRAVAPSAPSAGSQTGVAPTNPSRGGRAWVPRTSSANGPASLGAPSGGPASPGPAEPSTPRADLDGIEACLSSDGAREIDRYLEDLRNGHSEAECRELATRCSELVVRECIRRTDERPRDMYFRFWGDNAFELAQIDRLSTFAADVDTASYALARNYLNQGYLPEKAQVRTEEFVNSFAPDLAAPTEDALAITTELAPSLFGGREDRWMLRVGIRAREVSREARKPLVLTFVVDTSGSMQENGRLELVKHAVRLLVGELDARDKIGVVAFASDARLILPVTSASERGLIESALHPLRPEGSTNAEAGLRMGYELALGALDRAAVNRVILLSDGVANTGQTDQDRITASVRAHREKGIYLNTIGVGMNNHNDVLLEQLADKGDGICDYVDSAESARHAIVDRFTGAFEPVASDVKIQIEFDPAQVYRWRQLGYENRVLADADFRNDAVDAGEVGAGHQVVALYELERMSGGPSESPLATVRLRWKAPKAPGQDPREIDVTEREAKLYPAEALGSYDSASYGYRRAVLAAQFAEFLRRSTHVEGDRYSELMGACSTLAGQTLDPETAELATLVDRAATLVLQAHQESVANQGQLGCAISELRRLQVRRAEIESLRLEEARAVLDSVRAQSDALEEQIRELVRQRLHCEQARDSSSK